MNLMENRALEFRVDSGGEGGLVCDLDRSPMVDRPTLVIGLGGTGIDAMLQVKYRVQRKMLAPEGKKHPGRIAFLAVDTDEIAFREKRVGDVRVEESERVLISEPNLASYMKNHELIPKAYMKDWLCKGINADAIRFSAGGIRQCGRFMLIDRADVFIDKFIQAASAVWSAGTESGLIFRPDTPYDVYLLTGVCGGTGSGIFLDVAYLIREIVRDLLHRRLEMRGLLFMPSVNLCKFRDYVVRSYMPINGYAALRELDFWMNTSRGRNFRQRYTDALSVDTPDAPFDLCFLISPQGTNPNDYESCMRATGDAMMRFIDAAQPTPDGVAFDFEAWLVQLASMKHLGNFRTTYSGDYIYASLGVAERRLPLDLLANYIGYRLLTDVDALSDRAPEREEVEALFSRELKLDSKKGLWQLFDKSLTPRPFGSVVRTLDDFKEAISGYNRNNVLNQNLLEDALRNWVDGSRAVYNKALNDIVKDCVEALRRKIEEKFIDPDYGPYYAHRLLRNADVGKPDILKWLEGEKNAVLAFLAAADDRMEELRQRVDRTMLIARQNRYVPLISIAKYNEYVEALFRYYDHLRYTAFAEVAMQFYKRMLSVVTDYNNLVTERFADLLRALTEVFRRNVDVISDACAGDAARDLYVGDFDQIRKSVDQAMDALAAAGMQKELTVEFLKMILSERRAWVGDEGGLGKSFSAFVSEKFHAQMELTMEEIYMQADGLTSTKQLVDHLERTVLPGLQSDARLLYAADENLSPLSNAPSRTAIFVPSSATTIRQAVDEYISERGIRADVISSLRQGALCWLQLSIGLPLYALDSLPSYQRFHDFHGTVDKHLGRYLKMGEEENWAELLPPLMPEATWSYAQYDNPKWSKRNAATREMFREAWREGLVPPIEEGHPVHMLGRVNKAAYDALIAEAPIAEADRVKMLAGNAAAAAELEVDEGAVRDYIERAREFLNTGWKPSKEEPFMNEMFNLLGGGRFVTPENVDPERHYAEILEENLLWTPDIAAKLARQLELKKALERVVLAHENYLEMSVKPTEPQSFANALIFGVYKATEPKVFQLDGAEVGEPPVVLMDIPDYQLAPEKDPFYAMFRKYQTYDAEMKQTIEKICKQREAEMNTEMQRGETTRYDRCVKLVRNIDANMEKRLKEIDADESFDSPEIRDFYVEMREIFALFLPD